MKAKIKFVKFESALAMQVLYMDERFRAKDEMGREFLLDADKIKGKRMVLSIASWDYPCTNRSKDRIMLWGYRKREDNRLLTVYFPDNRQRDQYLADAIEALKDWADNWEGWGDDSVAMVDDGTDDSIIVEV